MRFNPNLYKNGKVCLSIIGYVSVLDMSIFSLYDAHTIQQCDTCNEICANSFMIHIMSLGFTKI